MYSPYDTRTYNHQACSSRSGVSLKTLLVLIHCRIFRPSHLLNSSLRLATAREQWNVGGRLGQPQHCFWLVLEHTSASKNDVPAKCFRLQATRCIFHAHRDYTRHTRTFRSDILHQHVLQLDSSLCSEQDASFMVGTNCPSLENRPGATTLHACHTLVFCDASSFSLPRPTCTSCHHSSSENDHPCRSNAWTCLPFSCGG